MEPTLTKVTSQLWLTHVNILIGLKEWKLALPKNDKDVPFKNFKWIQIYWYSVGTF